MGMKIPDDVRTPIPVTDYANSDHSVPQNITQFARLAIQLAQGDATPPFSEMLWGLSKLRLAKMHRVYRDYTCTPGRGGSASLFSITPAAELLQFASERLRR